MHDTRITELSNRQRECLRLVGRGFSTKEVAVALGISPETARDHIDAARLRLGVDRRTQAARMLLEFEAHPPHREGPPAMGMPDAGPVEQEVLISAAEAVTEDHLQDVAMPRYQPASSTAGPIRWPFRTSGRLFNDLAWFEQLAWALAIAIGSIVAVHEVTNLLR